LPSFIFRQVTADIPEELPIAVPLAEEAPPLTQEAIPLAENQKLGKPVLFCSVNF
jgi:hypothetical protein